MTEPNAGLTGFALILAYAIPIGLTAMLVGQAIRGRREHRRVRQAESEVERFAGRSVALVGDLESESEPVPEPEPEPELPTGPEDATGYHDGEG